ncbi:hypothetical protein PGB90_007975 [Kerria lacca]
MEANTNVTDEPSRPIRPNSSRRFSGRIHENANKRNKEVLSLVRQMSARKMLENESDDSFDDKNENDIDDDDDDDDDVQASVPGGGYDPKEFDQIPAPLEIKELFQYITKYSPQNIELEYKLAPFIPEYIPAVGDIDAFIKVSRPDNLASDLGVKVLDEPCMKQSDLAVLHLQLRAATKQTSAKRIIVKQIENANKNHKAVDRWIKDINDLHKNQHSSSFTYSNQMPDIDTLMQEWPTDFEEQLINVESLGKHLNCNLLNYVDIVCSLVDIPVYESRIESLHLLFSLYAAVKNVQIKADPATTNVIESR